jgi:hypothetical protein
MIDRRRCPSAGEEVAGAALLVDDFLSRDGR